VKYKTSGPLNIISNKKPNFSVGDDLNAYLQKYFRYIEIPVVYDDLLRFKYAIPLRDKNDEETLWHSVSYAPPEQMEINEALLKIYVQLTGSMNMSAIQHLSVDRIDYCLFGNSLPFRVKIINKLNDNHDYYYVKKADASRIYGLELEHILSPNKINFLTFKKTLIEEHIAGIPGDQFLAENLEQEKHNKVRIGKEFVKFNERCFVRLLGDMRAYNFVIEVTSDFDQRQYRIRAFDFDQQSYEGRKNMYLPQFFKENFPYVKMALDLLSKNSIEQYRYEEKTQIKRRISVAQYRLRELLNVMKKDKISTLKKVSQLRESLAKFHKDPLFKKCASMGEILALNMEHNLKAV
jgi:hypothetical protein